MKLFWNLAVWTFPYCYKCHAEFLQETSKFRICYLLFATILDQHLLSWNFSPSCCFSLPKNATSKFDCSLYISLRDSCTSMCPNICSICKQTLFADKYAKSAPEILLIPWFQSLFPTLHQPGSLPFELAFINTNKFSSMKIQLKNDALSGENVWCSFYNSTTLGLR